MQRDATRRITGQGHNKSATVDSPRPGVKAKASPPTKAQPLPPTTPFPLNQVQLPLPGTGASSSSSAPAPKAKSKGERGRSTSRKGAKGEGDNPEVHRRKTRAGRPASAAPAETQTADETGATVQKGVVNIEGKDRKWWARKPVEFIKRQIENRGHRFTDLDTKGGMVKTYGKFEKQHTYA